ncbi:unnamed protein product [Paramecium sonneborni]|uniref:Uncharacterized protein n=1 Tax=Paramecium sonneborni TaxID=65129 RepID=A0A8S1M7C0_9CILI|nr:unnamed protein product [Paramecium sonneborni]
MNNLNCKWKYYQTRKQARIIQLPRIRLQKDFRTKSIDDLFLQTKLNSQREEDKEEENILRDSDRIISISDALVKKKIEYEYEEDLTSIHNKCGIKVVNQAQEINDQVQTQLNNLSDYEKQKQQVNEIFKSLYTSHQEKRVNIKQLVSDRTIKNKPMDFNQLRKRLPKDKIGTIYDPTRFQNLQEKFHREIEANAPNRSFIRFRQFLIERRGTSYKD